MKIINRIVDYLVDLFGGLFFIILFNVVSFAWVLLGKFYSHFFDPFPYGFYTLIVSWLAINMSCFILRVERRNKERDEREKKRDIERAEQNNVMTEAILHLSESTQTVLSFLVQLAQENDEDLAEITEMMKKKRR